MPFTAACPFCPTKLLNVPETALGASVRCPQCGNYFTAVPPEQPPAARASPRRRGAPVATPTPLPPTTPAKPDAASDYLRSPVKRPLPAPAADVPIPSPPDARVTLCCFLACALAGAALLQPLLEGVRAVTIALAVLGLAGVVICLLANFENPKPGNGIWLALGFLLNGTVLGVALLAPSLLNSSWEPGRPVDRSDPNWQMLVAWEQPQQVLRLTADGWADARTEAIRQDDLLVRVVSLKVGVAPGQEKSSAPGKNLLVHLQLVNLGHEKRIELEGFSSDKHRPGLSGEDGQSCSFLEQRTGRFADGAIVFETDARLGPMQVAPRARSDVLLIFAAPPGQRGPWRLELPALAWGRQGVCRIRIAEPFEYAPPRRS
jgi:hypothetical protein